MYVTVKNLKQGCNESDYVHLSFVRYKPVLWRIALVGYSLIIILPIN